jgi:SNF2 family DNA or RNA helicase
MGKLYLNIPFDKKEEFKAICRKNEIKYLWDKDQKSWAIEGEKIEDKVPKSLKEFSVRSERLHVIDCDYTYFPFASKAGAKWDAKRRVAVYRGNSIPTELTGFKPKPLSHQEKMERELNKEQIKAIKPSKKIKPHSHQKEAKRFIEKAWACKTPGFLLADETGLGKTIATWLAILGISELEKKGLKVLITGPLNSLETWRETILWMGNKAAQAPQPIEVTLVNYEKLRNLFNEDEKKARTLKGIARYAEAEGHDIIVFDESHYLKNPTSARSKLARKLEESAKFTLWLSATAGQNPLELSYLSNLLGYITNCKGKTVEKDYELWCQAQGINVKKGKFGKWIWNEENSKEENLKIHNILFKSIKKPLLALRRRCTDIEGWPEIQRIPRSHMLEGEEVLAYQTDWKDFLKALEEDRLDRLKGKKDTTKGIAALGRLRQKASLLRVETTAELAQELLANGYQIAISVEYLLTLDKIKESLTNKGYKVVEFSGRNTAEREGNRKLYQEGKADVIIFSTESSISLHQIKDTDKPRAQINHDLRWSGIEQEQVDGRSHRNGRHAPIYWCFSKNTVEERVANILLEKLEAMNTIRGDKGVDFKHIYREISEQAILKMA